MAGADVASVSGGKHIQPLWEEFIPSKVSSGPDMFGIGDRICFINDSNRS
jgi:hypothetical protein